MFSSRFPLGPGNDGCMRARLDAGAIVREDRAIPERSDAMKVRLRRPEVIERRPDGQGGPSGRHLTTWQGEFEGAPDRWWREAFAMLVGEDLQGVCGFRITTAGYEFECGEDQIDDVIERLVAAAGRAGPRAERNKAKDRKHEDTLRLFARVEEIKNKMLAEANVAEQVAARRKLQEQMAEKFKGLEQ